MIEQDKLIEILNAISSPTPNFEYYFIWPGLGEPKIGARMPAEKFRLDDIKRKLEGEPLIRVVAFLELEFSGLQLTAHPHLDVTELIYADAPDPLTIIQNYLEDNIARQICRDLQQ